MPQRDFEDVVVPHLDAAFNYARWLTKNDVDAEDVVQDATIRALRVFPSLRNDDARAWLLAIVRNTWYGRVAQQSSQRVGVQEDMTDDPRDERLGPEALVLQQQTVGRVQRAVQSLPVDFREVIVLRELEGMSYKEIAAVVGVPIGTVMSRLSRARDRLLTLLRPAIADGGRA
ncbi:MAG TPA: sigma-70 family RNA polymerase sigma factor [Vicinamibacterales bacterium]|nr:sigma-70 family RNA polymerase sigma factor [Vicinamibacterales bacterium]